jgi:hypothetical protein
MKKGLGTLFLVAAAIGACQETPGGVTAPSSGALSPAASPHFLQASASGPDASGRLAVSFKEAGLGTNDNIDYTASATATAEYVCVTKSGRCPAAANKQTTTGQVTASGSFASGKNGQVTASLTISPPAAPSALLCGNGQTAKLASVSYTNVRITDTENNVTKTISGTFSRTFFTCP